MYGGKWLFPKSSICTRHLPLIYSWFECLKITAQLHKNVAENLHAQNLAWLWMNIRIIWCSVLIGPDLPRLISQLRDLKHICTMMLFRLFIFKFCFECTSRTTTSLVTFLTAVILMGVRGRKDVYACVWLCHIDACMIIEKFSLTAHQWSKWCLIAWLLVWN